MVERRRLAHAAGAVEKDDVARPRHVLSLSRRLPRRVAQARTTSRSAFRLRNQLGTHAGRHGLPPGCCQSSGSVPGGVARRERPNSQRGRKWVGLPMRFQAGCRSLVPTEARGKECAEMPTRAQIKTSVASRDGTEIAYWTSGDGPPIVLVHGAPADSRTPSPAWSRTSSAERARGGASAFDLPSVCKPVALRTDYGWLSAPHSSSWLGLHLERGGGP
jgi:hypothetical protein